MAILIPDMDMPENCCGCPMRTGYDDLCLFTGVMALNIGRQMDCPLVYVPDRHTPDDNLLEEAGFEL